MLVHRVAEAPRGAHEGLLQRPVRERLDATAVFAHEVVMVAVVAAEGLVARDAVADVDPLDEPQLRERVERPVDARYPDRAARSRDPVVDLLRRAAAVLRGEVVDDGPAGTAPAKARGTEGAERVV